MLVIETEQPIPYEKLGGTVKAGEIIESSITGYLKSMGKASIDFGVSAYGVKLPDMREIKRDLGDMGIKTRFVLPKEGTELSSVVVKKQRLVEFLVTNDYTARTVWVQDFEDWNKRDYGRPEVEAHIGMLPPKVARQMVNLAIPVSSLQYPATILDPFCGVGTIASEALVLGHEVIASDISSAQVQRTRENVEWLQRNFKFKILNFKLLQADAREISKKVPVGSVNAIVTEPDLGPNTGNTKYQTPGVMEKLEKLYLDALQDWKKVLKPNGTVVMVLPAFGEDKTLVKNVVDKLAAIGYILSKGPFEYSRPQAAVKRNICVFTYVTR